MSNKMSNIYDKTSNEKKLRMSNSSLKKVEMNTLKDK